MGLFGKNWKERKRDKNGRFARGAVSAPTPPSPSEVNVRSGPSKLIYTFGEDNSKYADMVSEDTVPTPRSDYGSMHATWKTKEETNPSLEKEKKTLNWLKRLDHSTDSSGVSCYCPACDPSENDSPEIRRAVAEFRRQYR
jgi:nucleosome binding factor SPN SPT16 subunit